MFMSLRDVGLFVRSARTDARIRAMRPHLGDQGTFDAVYRADDPWASADARYRYQSRKYDGLASLLPAERRFHSVLDLGCGLGLLGRRLARRADAVLGVDIAPVAIERAAALHVDLANLRFAHGDIRAVSEALDGCFDLVVVADTLCYLPPPVADGTLKAIAARIARLIAPGGLCLLANHFFFGLDSDSRLSRRIHQAFAWSPAFHAIAEYRRPFYLASLLEVTPGCPLTAVESVNG
jgi:SAM-dependent methyltransferase